MKLTDKGRRCAEANLHADFGHGKIMVIQKYTSPLNADSLYILKRRKSQNLFEDAAKMRNRQMTGSGEGVHINFIHVVFRYIGYGRKNHTDAHGGIRRCR